MWRIRRLFWDIFDNCFDDVDELFIALSSPSRGSSTPCLYLKTVDISYNVNLNQVVLVDFVQQRVKSDLDDPAPGLVTCLKLSDEICSDEKLYAQLVKTRSSSIIFLDHTLPCTSSVFVFVVFD